MCVSGDRGVHVADHLPLYAGCASPTPLTPPHPSVTSVPSSSAFSFEGVRRRFAARHKRRTPSPPTPWAGCLDNQTWPLAEYTMMLNDGSSGLLFLVYPSLSRLSPPTCSPACPACESGSCRAF